MDEYNRSIRDAAYVEIIAKIGQIAENTGMLAGVGGSETAGMIISCLYERPELIQRFMEEGPSLLVDGEILPEKGRLTFHRAFDGAVTTPEELRIARQARRVEIALDADKSIH